MQRSAESITIALSKGRILKETLPLFAAAGIEPLEDVHTSRKLIFETTQPNVYFIIIRAVDVPTYVEYGPKHGLSFVLQGKDSQKRKQLVLGNFLQGAGCKKKTRNCATKTSCVDTSVDSWTPAREVYNYCFIRQESLASD